MLTTIEIKVLNKYLKLLDLIADSFGLSLSFQSCFYICNNQDSYITAYITHETQREERTR